MVGTKREHLVVSEVQGLGIPTVAVLDINCDPDEVGYGTPDNDDVIHTVDLLVEIIADVCTEGLMEQSEGQMNEGRQDAELMAKWGRDLLQGETAQALAEAPDEAANPEAAHEAPIK